jgi:hypothetical protein
MAANPLVGTYDPKKVIITLGGVPIGGYADGFVQIDPNSETWTKKVGADGEVARALSNDNTHTIQITLMQTSLSNAYVAEYCFIKNKYRYSQYLWRHLIFFSFSATRYSLK